MDLVVLVVVLGTALGYVVVRYRTRRLPASPPASAEIVGRGSPEVPRAGRYTEDRMGVIRTSRPLRWFPRSPLLVIAVVIVALVVLINLPLL